jgi:hypothetical protein
MDLLELVRKFAPDLLLSLLAILIGDCGIEIITVRG